LIVKEVGLKKGLVLFAVLFVIVLSGCQKKPVAVVNGDEITKKVLDWHVEERMREHEAHGVSVNKETIRHAVLEQLITQKLLLQGARARNITVSDDEVKREVEFIKSIRGEEELKKTLKKSSLSMQEFMDIVREKIMVAKFIESLVPEDSITEEEIREYYKKSPTPFLKPETVFVRFIQTTTEDEAKKILEEMKQKKLSFDEMAELLSKENRAIVSGYGWTSPAVFSPEIASALKEMKKGDYGGPYKGKDGYYLLRVKDRREKGVKSLDESRDEIKNILLRQKRDAEVAHWVAERRSTALIVIN